MEKPIALHVYENEACIGTLSRFHENFFIFEYALDYIQSGGRSLCVTMPTAQRIFSSQTLHPFFTNYLAEGWLEKTQKRHLEGNFSPITKTFDIMSAFGSCFGALRFVLSDKTNPPHKAIFHADPLSEFKKGLD